MRGAHLVERSAFDAQGWQLLLALAVFEPVDLHDHFAPTCGIEGPQQRVSVAGSRLLSIGCWVHAPKQEKREQASGKWRTTK